MQKVITDDLEALLDILPPHIRQPLCQQNDLGELLEVVLDLGRSPQARFPQRVITLDPKLFADNDFFENKFHFIIHELFHWIKRRSEAKFYLKDSEEVQSFVLAIAWEIMEGKDIEHIYKTIYPIIEAHFENGNNSKKVFNDMVGQAEKLIEVHNSR